MQRRLIHIKKISFIQIYIQAVFKVLDQILLYLKKHKTWFQLQYLIEENHEFA